MNVASYADVRFSTYSTGIRQKFAIARGLLTEPRILFLDEPTRALDPIAAEEVRRYVADHIVDQLGYTAIIATHTLSEAEAICHRVAIIRHGRVVASGSLDELSERMRLSEIFELDVTGPVGGLDDHIRTMPGVSDLTVRQVGERSRIEARIEGHDGTLNRLLQAVMDAGARVDSSATRRPTLDDIYRAVHADE